MNTNGTRLNNIYYVRSVNLSGVIHTELIGIYDDKDIAIKVASECAKRNIFKTRIYEVIKIEKNRLAFEAEQTIEQQFINKGKINV